MGFMIEQFIVVGCHLSVQIVRNGHCKLSVRGDKFGKLSEFNDFI